MSVQTIFPFTRLVLVGTVHGDPQGYDRALQLLKDLAPDAVAVEISTFSLRYRDRHGPRWRRLFARALAQLPLEARQHLALMRVAAQIELPFEVQAAQDYSRAAGIPWQAVDASMIARRHLPAYARHLLAPANLRALLASPDEPLGQWTAAEYRRARYCLGRPPRRVAAAPSREAESRDRLMARRLCTLASRCERLVHLGGWEHLVPWPGENSLAHLVAHLNPVTLLLDEAGGWGKETGLEMGRPGNCPNERLFANSFSTGRR